MLATSSIQLTSTIRYKTRRENFLANLAKLQEIQQNNLSKTFLLKSRSSVQRLAS